MFHMYVEPFEYDVKRFYVEFPHDENSFKKFKSELERILSVYGGVNVILPFALEINIINVPKEYREYAKILKQLVKELKENSKVIMYSEPEWIYGIYSGKIEGPIIQTRENGKWKPYVNNTEIPILLLEIPEVPTEFKLMLEIARSFWMYNEISNDLAKRIVAGHNYKLNENKIEKIIKAAAAIVGFVYE